MTPRPEALGRLISDIVLNSLVGAGLTVKVTVESQTGKGGIRAWLVEIEQKLTSICCMYVVSSGPALDSIAGLLLDEEQSGDKSLSLIFCQVYIEITGFHTEVVETGTEVNGNEMVVCHRSKLFKSVQDKVGVLKINLETSVEVAHWRSDYLSRT